MKKMETIIYILKMLVISDLNEDIEYSIPISFIVTLATFSDVNEALKAISL